jgi:hypothetical protein
MRPAARRQSRPSPVAHNGLLTRTPPRDPDSQPLLVMARPVRRGGRQMVWRGAILALVILAALLVHGDVRPGAAPSRKPSSVTMTVPASPEEIRTLLTNTPLAIAPADAVTLNAARPLDLSPTSFARPFFVPATVAAAPNPGAAAALDCLTKAIYYEAASESDTGKRAVAQVVLNRVRSPIFPHTVCGVVFQGSEQRTGCQFSFTCDGSLARQPSIAGWASARRIALAALSGSIERSVGLSTHYHANYVVPYWAGSLDKVATIGAHIFYTMRGGLGRSPGFGARYDAGAETTPTVLPVDPNAGPVAELVGGGRTGETTDPAGVVLANRTFVKDDALGTPARPNLAPVTPKSALRADDSRGELVVDKNKGLLGK